VARSAAPSSLTNSPLMRPKNSSPAVFRGADIVRSTMGNAPENVSYHRVRSETYHGPLHELSDTDYAVSISSESETEDEQHKYIVNNDCDTSTLPFR